MTATTVDPASSLAELLRRSEDRASDRQPGVPAFVPGLRTVILCCADHRADPAHALGLGPNEAVVIRNPGGRVTQNVLENLLLLATVSAVVDQQAPYEILVMHHTHCGLASLDPVEHASILAPALGIDPEEVVEWHLGDPDRAVALDVDRLVSLMPATMTVSGLVHDIESGQTRVVTAPAPGRLGA